MQIPAWQIIAWAPVVTTIEQFDKTITRFRHLATSVQGDASDHLPRHGQVLWGTEVDGRMVGVAWDWSEVKRNIVAMADPMRVVTNLTLVANDGSPLEQCERLVFLNNAIHDMVWQSDVVQAALVEASPA
jgi:hypothetical protein